MSKHTQRDPVDSCNGKKIFLTFTRAKNAAARTSRAKGREGDHYHPYHCDACQKFHVGGVPLRRPKKIKVRVVR